MDQGRKHTTMSEIKAPEDACRLFVTWQSNLYDGYDHAITDEEFALGGQQQYGQYAAICGTKVCLTDSFLPPGPPCPRCVALPWARTIMRPPDE